MMAEFSDSFPMVTVAVPCLNHGRFLEKALTSIFGQDISVEVMLADGGSTDNTPGVIEKWRNRLSWWRSHPDAGQAAAINEAISRGSAPFVCWLNADDFYLEGGLAHLLDGLQRHPEAPVVYGRSWNTNEQGVPMRAYWTGPFSEWHLSQRCFISQPATLIRRQVWESVGGLDEHLCLAMDYDLWWKIARRYGPLYYLSDFVAANRVYGQTKTSSLRRSHWLEAMSVVKRYTGRVPLKWYLLWPWSVWFKSAWHIQRI